MSTQFFDYLVAREDKRPHYLAAAAALDASGIAFPELGPSLIILRVDGSFSGATIADLIQACVYPDRPVGEAGDDPLDLMGTGSVRVMRYTGARFRDPVAAVMASPGISIVIVDGTEKNGGELAIMSATADIDATIAIAQAHVYAAIRVVTGHDLSNSELAQIALIDCLSYVRPGIPRERLLALLRYACTPPVDEKSVKKEEPASAKTDTKRTFVPVFPEGPRLSTLAGYGDAADWGRQLARDLADYRSGRLDWADIDRGMLLVGPPGTGKTLFAKALAAEAGVPLIGTSYSEMQGKAGYMSDIMKSFREAFAEAKAAADTNGVCILAVDEIDSLPNRQTVDHRHRDWWTAIVNAILPLFDGHPGLVVLGMCNSSDLDPALTRPGRLDKRVEIRLPDVAGLTGILRHHAGDLEGLRGVAERCRGMSGADVEQLVRGARRRARSDGRPLSAADIHAEIDATRPRPEPALMRRIAVHEAGHAVAMLDQGIMTDIEIVPAEGSYATTARGVRDKVRFQQVSEIETRIVTLLSGRAAEAMVFGDEVLAGAGGPAEISDLAKATAAATEMETQQGIGYTGLVHVGSGEARLRPDINAAVSRRLEAAQTEADALVRRRRQAILAIAKIVERQGYAGADDIEAAWTACLKSYRGLPQVRQLRHDETIVPPEMIAA